jgi:hypothetical protein
MMTKDKTLAEEARLNTTCDRMVVAKGDVAAYGVAIHGAPTTLTGAPSGSKPYEEDAREKKE